MFPSSGYFRGLNCPFYSSGLCERPFCHFRHVESVEKRAEESHGSVDCLEIKTNATNPPLLDAVGNALKQIQKDIEIVTKPKQYSHIQQSVNNSRTKNGGSFSSNKRLDTLSSTTTPQYTPTPINELQKQASTIKRYTLASCPVYDDDDDDDDDDDCHKVILQDKRSKEENVNGSTKSGDIQGNSINNDEEGSKYGRFSVKESVSEHSPPNEYKSSIISIKECAKIDQKYSTDSSNKSSKDIHPHKSSKDTHCAHKSSRDTNSSRKSSKDSHKSSNDTHSSHKSSRDTHSSSKSSKDTHSSGETSKNTNSSHKSSRDSHSSHKSSRDTQHSHKSSRDTHTSHKSSRDTHSSHKSSRDTHSSHKSSRDTHRSHKSSKVTHSCSHKSSRGTHSSHKSSRDTHNSHKSSSDTKSNESSGQRLSSNKCSDRKCCSSKSSSDKQNKSSDHMSSSNQSSDHKLSPIKLCNEEHSKCETEKTRHEYHEICSNGSYQHTSERRMSKQKPNQEDKSNLYCKSINGDQKAEKIQTFTLFGSDESDDEIILCTKPSSSDDETFNIEDSIDIKMIISSDEEDSQKFDLPSDEDLEENDTFDECLQLFNETQKKEMQRLHKSGCHSSDKRKCKLKGDVEEPVLVGKKRKARIDAFGNPAKRNPVQKVHRLPTPAEVMQNRIIAMKNKISSPAPMRCENGLPSSSSNLRNPLLKKTTNSFYGSKSDKPNRTRIGTASGEGRIAHTPKKTNLSKPMIVADYKSKIPTNIRQCYLNRFIDECIKIYLDEKDAFNRALEEEKAVLQRAHTKNVYLNLAVITIKKLRNEQGCKAVSPLKNPLAASHMATISGAKAVNTSFTMKRSGKLPCSQNKFTGAVLYQRLVQYIMTDQQLIDNGFPRPDERNRGKVTILFNEGRKPKLADKPNERVCCRCGKTYQVGLTGAAVLQEDCVYHWGRSFKRKVSGVFDNRFVCCQGDAAAPGCQIASCHVSEENKSTDLSGYMKTIACSPPADGNFKVFALDCEMVYTELGQELARITVIDENIKSVYETLVKPERPVIDFNTRFSGITESDMRGVKTKLRDVQAVLLSMFNAQTILIGHSLESDFVALKLIHNTVVDTSVVFPHKLGPPYKRALRTLMAEYLQKIIQNDESGHDSQEDAISCLELMIWKIKEDAKKECRR